MPKSDRRNDARSRAHRTAALAKLVTDVYDVEAYTRTNPLWAFRDGLMDATLDRDANGKLIRKAGVMAIVLADGLVRPGDAVRLELPPAPHRALEPV